MHHCILAIIALLYSWATIYGKTNANFLCTLVGGGTYIIYRIAFYQPIINLDDFKLTLKVKPSSFDLFCLLAISTIALCFLPRNYIIAFGLTGLFSGFYFLIISYKKVNRKGIRAFLFIKNLFLATMWTIGTAMLPLYITEDLNILDSNIFIRFLFILIVCVAIDLRDIKSDEKAGTITLPTWMGFKNTKLVCFILLTIYFSLLVSVTKCNFTNVTSDEIVYYLTGFILGFVLIYLKPKHQQKTYTKLLDGCMLFQATGLFLASALKIN